MKLITSYLETKLDLIVESTATGGKNLFIEGIFIQGDKPNRNSREYPMGVLKPAVEKYHLEQVKTGRAVGELNHPEGVSVNLDKVSHRITSLKWDGNNCIGKALILNTPMGNIVKGLLEGGCQLGVSTRGLGSLSEKRNGISIVADDFMLTAVDIVQDPSAPEAFVNGIMEGVEYFFDTKLNKFIAEEAEKSHKILSKKTKQQILECQAAELSRFLSAISSKL
jgi:hypothetical protein